MTVDEKLVSFASRLADASGAAIRPYFRQRIEVTHKSSSRATYAQGSLRAVRFLADQKTGLFDMFDVLSLR